MGAIVVGIVVSAATYALVAVGFGLIFSVTKIFHFAHSVVYVIAGYVAYSLREPLGLVPAILLAVVASAAVAGAIDFVIYEVMQRRRAGHFQVLVASLGLQALLLGAVASIWGTIPLALDNPFAQRAAVHVGPFVFSWLDAAAVVGAIVVLGAAFVWLYRTRPGMECLAVADNPAMAETLGISLPRVRLRAMVAGTLISGPSAVLAGMYQPLTPGMGAIPLFIGFSAVLVGGVGTIPAAVVGVVVLSTVDGLADYWLPGSWSLAVTFAVVLVFMLVRPRGLLMTDRRVTATVARAGGVEL